MYFSRNKSFCRKCFCVYLLNPIETIFFFFTNYFKIQLYADKKKS